MYRPLSSSSLLLAVLLGFGSVVMAQGLKQRIIIIFKEPVTALQAQSTEQELNALLSSEHNLQKVHTGNNKHWVIAVEPALEPDALAALLEQLRALDTVKWAEQDKPMSINPPITDR